jgi:hypothetical protein
MFWFIILLIIVAIVGISWAVGTMINRRTPGGRHMSRQEQITAAKVSGAFPFRKENRP